ncbi:hypothetical protein B7486_72915, partial [cyanobacterium TDX16]
MRRGARGGRLGGQVEADEVGAGGQPRRAPPLLGVQQGTPGVGVLVQHHPAVCARGDRRGPSRRRSGQVGAAAHQLGHHRGGRHDAVAL